MAALLRVHEVSQKILEPMHAIQEGYVRPAGQKVPQAKFREELVRFHLKEVNLFLRSEYVGRYPEVRIYAHRSTCDLRSRHSEFGANLEIRFRLKKTIKIRKKIYIAEPIVVRSWANCFKVHIFRFSYRR